MLDLTILLLTALFPTTAPAEVPAPPLVAAFTNLCLSNDPAPAAILARAEANGWTKGKKASERIKPSAAGELTLDASDTLTAGEHMGSCGVKVSAETPDIAAAMTAAIGFAPAFSTGNAATFFAVRDGSAWHSGAALSPDAFRATKAQGRFFSIVTGSADGGSWVVYLQPVPESPAHP